MTIHIPSVPWWYNGTEWTVGIKLAHVVHLGPVPSPKCAMVVQWDDMDSWD